MSSTKWIFLVDCNSFYASCERLFQPSLRRRPIVVLSRNEGCVIARSKEAKTLGIPMGAPAFQWKEFFRIHNVYSCAAHFSFYCDISRRVMEVLAHFSPDIEEYSIDEAFLQITCKDPLLQAEEMKRRIEQWTGIPVSVGIGTSKTLAKLASSLAKKSETALFPGICQLDPSSPHLSQLDVQEIWGVGSRLSDQLRQRGIFTVKSLKECDLGWIKKQFSVVLQRTVLELRGISCLPLEEIEEPNQSILCSRSFKTSVESLEEIRASLASYAARAAVKLRAQQSVCSALTVFLSSGHGTSSEAATCQLPEPTDYSPHIIASAGRCLEMLYRPGRSYKKVGVLLAHFLRRQFLQEDLFASSPQSSHKQQRAMQALDATTSRFGKGTLRFASQAPDTPPKRSRYTTCWEELFKIDIDAR